VSLQALATPSRLRILARLHAGAASVNELAEVVGMEPSAVSHQLRMLRHLAGVIGFLGNEIAARIRLRAGRRLDSPALVAVGADDQARAVGCARFEQASVKLGAISGSLHITVFEVPPEADRRFLDGRRHTGVLYRALREDVAFRFVAITDTPVRAVVPSRSGVYEVVHADGAPDGREGVTLINPFEVPGGLDERFLAGWHGVRDALATQRGYLGTRLHRGETADLRYVNVARWSSPLMFARALRSVDTATPFVSHPALYLVV
jgi:DNA-binding transcriptional ArsR family regulator